MVCSSETEYVRRKVERVGRDASEIGKLICDALERVSHLRREKARAMDEFRRREEALGAEIESLVAEQKGHAPELYDDLRCEVWYDLESGERILTNAGVVVARRPMTTVERTQAERLEIQ